jgi:hypothetical protein
MNDYRFEALATIRSGEHEGRIDGGPLRLVRVVLSDGGTVVAPDRTAHRKPDVICPLRQKRGRSPRLLALATQAEERTQR